MTLSLELQLSTAHEDRGSVQSCDGGRFLALLECQGQPHVVAG